MVELKPGQLVRSLAGRDKGKHYLVFKMLDDRYVTLVDGRSRPLSRPKKKNRVHLQHYERNIDFEKISGGNDLNDDHIFKALQELVPDSEVSAEEV